MTVCRISRGDMFSTSPRRRYSRWRGAPAGGSLDSSTCTTRAMRLVTIWRPSRSTISPRGAWMRTSRTWLELACETYWSPDSTCRYQRRKKTTANSTSAMPPRTAMRRVRAGLIGGRRSSGSWITAWPPFGPRARGGSHRQAGRSSRTPSLLGAMTSPRRPIRRRRGESSVGAWIGGRSRERAQSRSGPRAATTAQLVGQRWRQPAARDREHGQRDERVDEDGGDDLAHEQQADRRVDAEQELHDPVAALGHQRGGRPDGERHERALRVARLAQAPGQVADQQQHQRRQPERLDEREVEEQPRAEADDGAGHRAAEQPGGHDDERREVRDAAEDRDLRDGDDLEQRAAECEGGQPRGERGRHVVGSRVGFVSTCTKFSRRRLANGRRWTRW